LLSYGKITLTFIEISSNKQFFASPACLMAFADIARKNG
jgi:hypothetical protein